MNTTPRSFEHNAYSTAPQAQASPLRRARVAQDPQYPVLTGVFKWFDEHGRRWGFIIPDETNEWNKEVFFSWQQLRDCAIKESLVQPEGRVAYQCRAPKRPGLCPEVTWLSLL